MATLTYEMLLVAFAVFLTCSIVLLFFDTAMPSLCRGGDRGEQGPVPLIKVILHYKFPNLTKIIYGLFFIRKFIIF